MFYAPCNKISISSQNKNITANEWMQMEHSPSPSRNTYLFLFLLTLEFYCSGCGHCKTMKADYARAAHSLSRDAPGSTLAAIDCVQYPRVSSLLFVRPQI
jgi:hypothetical protein